MSARDLEVTCISVDKKLRWTAKIKPNSTWEKVDKLAGTTILTVDGDKLMLYQEEMKTLRKSIAEVGGLLGIALNDGKMKTYSDMQEQVDIFVDDASFILGVREIKNDNVKLLNFAVEIEKTCTVEKFHTTFQTYIEKLKRMEM